VYNQQPKRGPSPIQRILGILLVIVLVLGLFLATNKNFRDNVFGSAHKIPDTPQVTWPKTLATGWYALGDAPTIFDKNIGYKWVTAHYYGNKPRNTDPGFFHITLTAYGPYDDAKKVLKYQPQPLDKVGNGYCSLLDGHIRLCAVTNGRIVVESNYAWDGPRQLTDDQLVHDAESFADQLVGA
jgi:hypothetical protein